MWWANRNRRSEPPGERKQMVGPVLCWGRERLWRHSGDYGGNDAYGRRRGSWDSFRITLKSSERNGKTVFHILFPLILRIPHLIETCSVLEKGRDHFFFEIILLMRTDHIARFKSIERPMLYLLGGYNKKDR